MGIVTTLGFQRNIPLRVLFSYQKFVFRSDLVRFCMLRKQKVMIAKFVPKLSHLILVV